jgi:DNA-binding transcriptional LysR family regulator
LNAIQETEIAAADLRGAERGVVRIVSLPSATVYVLPPKIAAFKRDHPRIDIVLEEKISTDIPQLVLAGAFDLGVTQALLTAPGMTRTLIQEDELLLAVPEGHPLAARTEIRLAEASNERFVVTKRNTEFRTLAMDLCRRAGFEMQAAFEADHFDSLQAYAAVGIGVALIPKSTILNTLNPKPRYIRITHPEAKRRLWLLWPARGLKNKSAELMVPYLKRVT